MPNYESVLIARQDISSAQVDAIADQMTEVIKEGGGEVTRKEYWGLRNLAYRIKKNRKGHYMLLNISAPTEAVQEMGRRLRLHEDVLRHLSLRVEALEEEPSVMMRSRGGRDRDERGGRGRRDDRGDRRGGRSDTGEGASEGRSPRQEKDKEAEKEQEGAE